MVVVNFKTEPQLGGAISTSSPPAPPPPPRQYRAEYRWQTSSSGVPLPVNAVVAGWDSFGNLIYAGRAVHEGNLLPAKIIPDHGCAYISYAGEEHRKMEYEVLCGQDLGWKADSCDRVPREAIRVGYTADGEHLYMGRLRMSDGGRIPGVVQPSERYIHVHYNGQEYLCRICFFLVCLDDSTRRRNGNFYVDTEYRSLR